MQQIAVVFYDFKMIKLFSEVGKHYIMTKTVVFWARLGPIFRLGCTALVLWTPLTPDDKDLWSNNILSIKKSNKLQPLY